MLVKQRLVGAQNGCIVTSIDLETMRLQLPAAADVLKKAGDILEFDTVQKIQELMQ